MKHSCYIIFSIVVILFGSSYLNAQDDSTYLKHSIKTNVFQWGMNEANIAYEHRFSLRFGLESTIGFYGIIHAMDEGVFSGPAEYRSIPYQGVTIRVNPKFYVMSDKRRRAEELYISTMLLLKWNKAEDYFRDDYGYQYYDQKRTIFGASVLGGVQSNFAKHFLADIYMGLGMRYRIITSYRPRHEEFVPSIHLGLKLGYGFKPIN